MRRCYRLVIHRVSFLKSCKSTFEKCASSLSTSSCNAATGELLTRSKSVQVLALMAESASQKEGKVVGSMLPPSSSTGANFEAVVHNNKPSRHPPPLTATPPIGPSRSSRRFLPAGTGPKGCGHQHPGSPATPRTAPAAARPSQPLRGGIPTSSASRPAPPPAAGRSCSRCAPAAPRPS